MRAVQLGRPGRHGTIPPSRNVCKDSRRNALGGAEQLLGPFLALLMGLSLVTVAEGARVLQRAPHRLKHFCMLLGGAAMYMFWRAPASNVALNATLLIVAGFFVYGPQALVGISAANLATKKAAATAVGLTGLFGYASTILSGHPYHRA